MLFSKGRGRKIGRMKRARIIESTTARTKVKDMVPSENKDAVSYTHLDVYKRQVYIQYILAIHC